MSQPRRQEDAKALAKPRPPRKAKDAGEGEAAPAPQGGLPALVSLGRILNDATSPAEISAAAFGRLRETVRCDGALLRLAGGGHESPVIVFAEGCLAEPEGEAKEWRQCLREHAEQDALPVFLSGSDKNSDASPKTRGLTGALAGLPLGAGERRLGYLALAWRKPLDLRPWEAWLSAGAELLAAALRRSRLQGESERRLAELARSEERFRTIFYTSPEAASLTSWKTGRLVEVNQGFLDMTGYTRQECLEKGTTDLGLWVDPDDRAGVLAALEREGEASNLQIDFRVKDGRVATGFTSAKLIEIAGEPFILGFTRDITALKTAEEALRRSEEDFRQLAENVGEVFWLRSADEPFRYIYVSPAFEEVWGRSRDEVYRDAEVLLSAILPEDRLKVEEAMRSNRLTGGGRHQEFRIERPDGSIRWIWARRFPIRNQAGEVYRVAGLAQDVTERRLAEKALLESEGKLAAVMNSVGEIMLMLDERLEVLWANDVARQTFGRDLEGRRCHDICKGSPAPCRQCLALATLADGESHEIETGSRSLEGRNLDLWGRATVASRHEDGRPKSVVVVYRDVTERRALQAEAMNAGHLASIGELAAGVAHEINNPINGIINCAELLAQAGTGSLSREELIGRIIKEGERVATIVSSLLSFARQGEQAMAPFPLPMVLADCLALMDAQLKKDGIIFRLELPDDLPLIWGNSHQLQQVFLNLMSNARFALNQKHAGSHPEKKLFCTAFVDRDSGRPLVRLSLRDQGTGITAEVRDKIFDPFFTTKPRGKGTGLGLSISHGIISDHGGRLLLDSLPGEYTEAVIELPAYEGSPGE